ncbi:MAG: hypothetical protein HYY64_15305 [Candidatus Rokubacteria bacterium]|nr:hypothetical protein [Candidatus Rokubacteria bacterium]
MTISPSVGPRYAERHGGYTRIIKAGHRAGDGAPLVLMELVDRPETQGEEGEGQGGQGREGPPGKEREDRRSRFLRTRRMAWSCSLRALVGPTHREAGDGRMGRSRRRSSRPSWARPICSRAVDSRTRCSLATSTTG